VLLAAASIGILSGCGGDRAVAGMLPAVATTTAPPPTEAPAPTPTEAPAPTPAEPTPDPAPPTEPNPIAPDDDDLLQGFLVLVGLLLAAAAVIAVIVAIVRSRKPAPQPGPRRTTAGAGSRPPSPQTSLLSTSQWINDQLSLELMAAAPEAAAQRWTLERSRLDNVAIGAQQQFLQTGAADWQLLGQAMSALAMALDTNVQLRSQGPPNAELIDESVTVVNRQRAELRQLIVTMRPTIER
jgi:hypothetical protein